jgi:hypothetical protein
LSVAKSLLPTAHNAEAKKLRHLDDGRVLIQRKRTPLFGGGETAKILLIDEACAVEIFSWRSTIAKDDRAPRRRPSRKRC